MKRNIRSRKDTMRRRRLGRSERRRKRGKSRNTAPSIPAASHRLSIPIRDL